MEALVQTVIDTLTAYVTMIVTTPQNAPILLASWWLVERTDKLITWCLASPRFTKIARVRWMALAAWGKEGAAAFWCSALAWVPYAQQQLCAGVDRPDCQTLVERLAAPIAMGLALSWGHKLTAAAYRKVTGSQRKRRVVCANCRKTTDLYDLNDSCRNCGQPPHEVTTR